MTKILVTGSAGFIGSHVAEALLKRGDTVSGLDNFNDFYSPARKRANAAILSRYPRFTLHEVDLRDAEGVGRICAESQFDVIIHLGAMANVRYSIERGPLYVDVNVRGTVNLLEGARKAGTSHVVFASTSSVYGKTEKIPFREEDPAAKPLAPYPATKLACEMMGYSYHNMFDLSFTALRFFSVYGPRGRPDMMPFIITDSIVHGKMFKLYEAGQMHRDWTYVGDIVSGVLSAADRPLGYEIVNLGRGEPVLMADFVTLVEDLVGTPAQMTTPPAPASEPSITFADISKAQQLFNYEPKTPVSEGMERFWEWYQETIIR